MDPGASFGAWLEKRRKAFDLTREELAQRAGCSVSALRKIETDERRLSKQLASLLADCLEIPPEDRPGFLKIARGEQSLQQLYPPVPLPALPPILETPSPGPNTQLPSPPTPLVGREQELKALGQLLTDPQCRIITLVGPGGIGKTRLAIEIAFQMEDNFADGVFFVPLAHVNSARFVVPVVADAIGFTFQSAVSPDPKTQLFNCLREKHILLLVDNLEHLVNEQNISELLAELIQKAPKIMLLTTSREPLNIRGEWVFEVFGLPVPENGSTEGSAVELFEQCARRAYREFNPNIDDSLAIQKICKLVEGMPLGIELAAAWVRTISCTEIAHEIEHGLDFLSISACDLPVRHRSMRGIFDHSWELLAEEEQSILLRLSVFRGGFTREAAEQVAEATLFSLSHLGREIITSPQR